MERDQKCENMGCDVWSKLGMTVHLEMALGSFHHGLNGSVANDVSPSFGLCLVEASCMYEDELLLSSMSLHF